MTKTDEEINEKIRKGKAVVYTAEEIIDVVREKGIDKTAEEVDVVTTGTFGAMCSSGAFINFGHSDLPNESGEYRGYPGDQFRKGWAQFSFRVPAFQHHFIPVLKRIQCCEDSEGKHF